MELTFASRPAAMQEASPHLFWSSPSSRRRLCRVSMDASTPNPKCAAAWMLALMIWRMSNGANHSALVGGGASGIVASVLECSQ